MVKIICPQCGFTRDVPEAKLPKGPVIAKCPRCACRFHFSAKSGAGAIVPPQTGGEGEEEDIRVIASNAYNREAQRFENERKAAQAAREYALSKNPWELAPTPDGWITAFYQTVIRVMFQAPNFFRSLRPDSQIWRPLSFFLIICVAQTLIEYGWSSVLYSFLTSERINDPHLQEALQLVSPAQNLPLLLVLRTGMLLFQLFVFAFLMYLAYRVVAPGQANFMLVYQVLIYSCAPWLLCIIPGLGTVAGAIWGIGCLAIGCKSALGLNWPQTLTGFLPLIAVMIPLVSQLAGILGKGI